MDYQKQIKLPPPKRWLVETGTDDFGIEVAEVVECTGEEDPCYIVGMENPWLGCTLDDLEKYALENKYSPCTHSVLLQIKAIKATL